MVRILSEMDMNINFIMDQHGVHAMFSDITLFSRNNKLESDIFYKRTGSLQYLDFRSSHRRSSMTDIHFNLARRICSIVTKPETQEMRLSELRNFL